MRPNLNNLTIIIIRLSKIISKRASSRQAKVACRWMMVVGSSSATTRRLCTFWQTRSKSFKRKLLKLTIIASYFNFSRTNMTSLDNFSKRAD